MKIKMNNQKLQSETTHSIKLCRTLINVLKMKDFFTKLSHC
jgi:hypothetical protein